MAKQTLREVYEIVQDAVRQAAGGQDDGLVPPELRMMIAEKIYDATPPGETICLQAEGSLPGEVTFSVVPARPASRKPKHGRGRAPSSDR